MSAFKRIQNSDTAIVPYTANKRYTMNYLDGGVEYLNTYRGEPTYNSILHSYYPSFITGSLSGYADRMQSLNYISASLEQPKNSYIDPNNLSYSVQDLSNLVQVFSISKNYHGEGVQPGSFTFTVSKYILPTYNEDEEIIGGDYVQDYPGVDDSNGNLILWDAILSQNVYVGNIFYNQGVFTITNTDYIFDDTQAGDDFNLSFLNSLTIYEQTFRLRVKQHEFNYSYNPTLLDQSGSLQSFSTTGSFQPYITSVGLYNEDRELLAVAKFGQPIPMSANTDYNFNIKLDR